MASRDAEQIQAQQEALQAYVRDAASSGELPASLRKSPNFGVEVDALPGGFVCSGSLKAQLGRSPVKEVLAGERPIRKLFTKEQRAFFSAHAPEGHTLDDLRPLGPINVLKLKLVPKAYGRRLVAELWFYPDGSRILEFSTKCLPSQGFQVAAEVKAYLSGRGIDLTGEQQTKTRTALEYFSRSSARPRSWRPCRGSRAGRPLPKVAAAGADGVSLNEYARAVLRPTDAGRTTDPSATRGPVPREGHLARREQAMATTERLSSIEAIMWRIGHDATLRMTVGTLMVLDHPPTRAALVDRLAEVAAGAPRLRRRFDDPARVRTRAAWVEKDDFDAGHHVRVVAVPSPGDQRQVLDLIGLLEPSPFDPDRSPWDVTVIEGLEGGRGGLYLRAHHALTDGIGGLSLISLLLDEPGRSPAKAVQPVQPAQPNKSSEAVDVESAPAADGRRPGTVTVTIDFTKAAGAAAGAAAALNVDPLDAVVRGVQRGLDVASSVSRQVVVTGGPLSPLLSSRSMTSRFDVISVPGARAASLALGGSRNDLLVAAAATGLGLYHEQLGLQCPELRLAMPASRHRDGVAGGNWFAPTRVEIPATGAHPGPQFGVVAERLARARSEPAVRLTAALASAISHLPTRLLVPALHAQASTIDFVATSLPGLRREGHICGAAIEESYPFGPRLGCLMNVTGFGNADRLDVGIAVDTSAIQDPDALHECLVSAFRGFGPKVGAPASRPKDRTRPPG